MPEYLNAITALLSRLAREQGDALAKAADAVADVICRDGLVHVFGCGHSHLAALDTFYRAGGLACVSPLLDEDLMLHDGAAKSSRMEKMPGIAAEAFRRARVDPAKDLLVVVSASGKNAAPVEMCACAKRAAYISSARNVTSPDGLTISSAGVPVVRETPARQSSSSLLKMISCVCSAPSGS